MATDTRTRVPLVIGASLAILLSGIGDAYASCNLIPVAKRRFPSAIGGVTTPITARAIVPVPIWAEASC